MPGPLTNLRAVEFAGLGPAPLAGQLLADFGATVISIDRHSGDADATDINRRNKQSIALDLKSPDAVEIALRLLDTADVLVEGFRPGVMERLGLGPQECLARNPRLVYGRITGWGQAGPRAPTAGHDINYLSLTGALNAIGNAGAPPTPPLNLVADYGGGTLYLLLGILAAVHERSLSGRGQVVDAAMIDGVCSMLSLVHSFTAGGKWHPERQANLLDGGAPFYRCYATSDDGYMAVGALEPAFFEVFARIIELPKRFASNQYNEALWPDMHLWLEQAFLSSSREHWQYRFENTDACVTPVLRLEEVHQDAHIQARSSMLDLDGVIQSAVAPRLDRTPGAEPQPPTAPGGDSDALLLSLGFDTENIARLRANNVVT